MQVPLGFEGVGTLRVVGTIESAITNSGSCQECDEGVLRRPTKEAVVERRATLPGSPSNPVKEGELDRFTKLGKKYFKAYTALGATVPEHLKEFAPD